MFSDFTVFLDILVDQSHKQYQAAWYEFESRYKQKILRKLHAMLQNEDLARECFARVCERLIDRNYKAIRDYQKHESEGAFVVYLIRIAWNIALNEVKNQLGVDIEGLTIESDERSNNYSEIKQHRYSVILLRSIFSITKKGAYTSERDIFIFCLRTVYELPSKEIAAVPVFEVNDHMVDLIVSKIRKLLKKRRKR